MHSMTRAVFAEKRTLDRINIHEKTGVAARRRLSNSLHFAVKENGFFCMPFAVCRFLPKSAAFCISPRTQRPKRAKYARALDGTPSDTCTSDTNAVRRSSPSGMSWLKTVSVRKASGKSAAYASICTSPLPVKSPAPNKSCQRSETRIS